MAPEDIRCDCDDQDGWDPSGPVLKRHPSNNGTMALSSWGRSRLSQNEPIKDYAPPQNGINRNICHIDVPNTDSVVIEVERVLSNPNMHEIEKDQEQSLLDAIARLDKASDSESEDMATEGRMGSAGDHMDLYSVYDLDKSNTELALAYSSKKIICQCRHTSLAMLGEFSSLKGCRIDGSVQVKSRGLVWMQIFLLVKFLRNLYLYYLKEEVCGRSSSSTVEILLVTLLTSVGNSSK